MRRSVRRLLVLSAVLLAGSLLWVRPGPDRGPVPEARSGPRARAAPPGAVEPPAPPRAPAPDVPVAEPAPASSVAPPAGGTPPARGVVRHATLARDPAVWLRPSARLELFEDAVFDVRMRRRDARSAGSDAEVWYGAVEGIPGAEVVAARVDGAVSMSVMLPDGRTFAISAGAGGHVVEELRASELPGCGAAEVHAAPPGAAAGAGDTGLPAVSQGSLEPSTTIDVLVLYTRAAELALGGSAGAEARIAMSVAATNAAYESSGVRQRLRLVHSAPVDGYSEPDALGDSLDHLTATGDRRMDHVHRLRDDHGADQVSLITAPASPDSCGIAWVPTQPQWMSAFAPYAFSVVAARCTGSPQVFAHELAHNQGARHDPATARSQGTTDAQIDALPAPFSSGYIAPDDAFHTIMAYGSSCGWCSSINRYSNPELRVDGIPAGDARSDVHGTLNATYHAAVAWRGAVFPFVPGAPVMLEP